MMWRTFGACVGKPPEWWHPLPASDTDDPIWPLDHAVAIWYCQQCPVVDSCGDYQAATNVNGVWGGEYHGGDHDRDVTVMAAT